LQAVDPEDHLYITLSTRRHLLLFIAFRPFRSLHSFT